MVAAGKPGVGKSHALAAIGVNGWEELAALVRERTPVAGDAAWFLAVTSEQTRAYVIAAAKQEDPEVRKIAVRALGACKGNEEVVGLLRLIAQSDTDEVVRDQAVEALERVLN